MLEWEANYIHSPSSVSLFAKEQKTGTKENGAPFAELDEDTRLKAEARYFSYYELFADPDPNAQGPAIFS